MEKRTSLLTQNLTEDKNVTTTVAQTVAADKKFLKRQKQVIENEIEDAEEELRKESPNSPGASALRISMKDV